MNLPWYVRAGVSSNWTSAWPSFGFNLSPFTFSTAASYNTLSSLAIR